MQVLHKPVMCQEVLGYLLLQEGDIILDATIGLGGHAREILSKITPGGRLIGVDHDKDALKIACENLKTYINDIELVHGDFRNLDKILKKLNLNKVDGMLFDLGVSSFQLDNPERGFSFQVDGPLDMRMDKTNYISAYDLVNNLTEKELALILETFGQERFHNRIAHYLVEERKNSPIETTKELSRIILRAIGRHSYQKIHPATRSFQALRIAVNRELEALSEGLGKSIDFLRSGSRICVISFHSLEDRIVKTVFKDLANKGILKIITKKPVRANFSETKDNPRSRSAKLRVAERL
ncbi:MAG: 16S rRNA (cytosine(1402)-N(4))-methyltransferase RsmH [Candidatus Omnitrophota bacterium]